MMPLKKFVQRALELVKQIIDRANELWPDEENEPCQPQCNALSLSRNGNIIENERKPLRPIPQPKPLKQAECHPAPMPPIPQAVPPAQMTQPKLEPMMVFKNPKSVRNLFDYYDRTLLYSSLSEYKLKVSPVENGGFLDTGEIPKYFNGQIEDILDGVPNGRRVEIFVAPFALKPVVFRNNNDIPYYYPLFIPYIVTRDDSEIHFMPMCDNPSIYMSPRFLHYSATGERCIQKSELCNLPILASMENYERHAFIEGINRDTTCEKYIQAVKDAFYDITGIELGDRIENEYFGFVGNLAIFRDTECGPKSILRRFYKEFTFDNNKLSEPLYSLLTGEYGFNDNEYIPNEDPVIEKLECGILHHGTMGDCYPLSDTQRKALNSWLKVSPDRDVMVVNGPPGTGKTTLIQSLVASRIVDGAVKGKRPYMALCCASTNQAITNIIQSFRGAPNSLGKRRENLRWTTGVEGYATYFVSERRVKEQGNPACPHIVSRGDKSDIINGKMDKSEGLSPSTGPEIDSLSYHDIQKRVKTYVERIESWSEQYLKFYNAQRSGISVSKTELARLSYNLDCHWRKLENAIQNDTVFDKDVLTEYDFETICSDVDAFEGLLDRTYRFAAFVWSIRYWEVRWYKSKIPQSYENFLWDTAMLTPCMVATYFTAITMFKESRDETIMADELIIDEAGQTSPEVGLTAFNFARKAVVLGDVHQLEPIWPVNRDQDIYNAVMAGLIDSYRKDAFSALEKRGLAPSSGNMIKLAQSVCCVVDNECLMETGQPQRGIMLREHRRCRKEIIEYCSELVYHGLLRPLTKERENYLFPPLAFVPTDSPDCKGAVSRCNPGEAEQIADWIVSHIEGLIKEYNLDYWCDGDEWPQYSDKTLEDIMVVLTPFTAQITEIQKALAVKNIVTSVNELKRIENTITFNTRRRKLPKKPIVVGTVHKMQGAEAPIVLFSSVYGSNSGGMAFIDMKPNMLNVAVSRAKDSFIVFGSERLYKGPSIRGTEKLPSQLLKEYTDLVQKSLNRAGESAE